VKLYRQKPSNIKPLPAVLQFSAELAKCKLFYFRY